MNLKALCFENFIKLFVPFFFFFLRCKIVMELVVQNERTGYYKYTQVYSMVSVYPAKLTFRPCQ